MFFFGKDGNAAKILYSNNGRSGFVHYKSKEGNFDLYYEFGGGNVVASIQVSTAKDWVAKTGLPLEKREEVLHFIEQRVVKDQTTSGRGFYKVEGPWLNIYS